MKAIGIILAGGNNKRMNGLTERRAIAAMPVCGMYRAIDFSLTNMTYSHIQKVAVLTQYNTKSLNEHLSSSKWWDFGRKMGGLFVYHPTITPENSNWYRGTVDAIYQNLHFLRDSHEPYVVIASGDGIYRLDYEKVVEQHIERGSDITMVTATLQPWEDSLRFGQVLTDETGRVRTFEEKPMQEISREVNAGIYVIRRRLLIELLETCMQEDRYDFVRDVIARYYTVKRIDTYHLDSYWSNISSADSYFKTNMDFLRPEVRDFFFRGEERVLTKISDYPPAKFNPGSQVMNSLVATGTIINGNVKNSIISKKSYVGNQAVIENSILLNDVYISDGAVIKNCIVESHNTIYANAKYEGDETDIKVIRENHNRFII